MSRRYKILLSGALLCIVAIAIIIYWATSPNEGSISQNSPARTAAVVADKRLEGVGFSVTYKGKYVLRTDEATNGAIERYTLSSGGQDRNQILVSVSELPDGRLSSNGDYIYRQKSPAAYSNRSLAVANGNTAEIWVRQDATEQTAMIAKNNSLLTISLTSPGSNTTDMTIEMDAMLKSLALKL